MSNSRRLGLIAVAVLIAVAAFLLLRPNAATPPPAPSPTTASPTSSTPADRPPSRPTAPEYTKIDASGGGDEPVEVTVTKGETVRLAFSSDVPAEVHIHGYEREFPVAKGKTVRMSFKAGIEGVFEVENHDTGVQIAELRVEP